MNKFVIIIIVYTGGGLYVSGKIYLRLIDRWLLWLVYNNNNCFAKKYKTMSKNKLNKQEVQFIIFLNSCFKVFLFYTFISF